MNLRTKLTLVLLGLAAIPLFVAAGLGLGYFATDKESFIFELNRRTSAAAASDAERNVGRIIGSLKAIATVASDPSIPPAQREVLTRNFFRESRFLAVAISENGRMLAGLTDSAKDSTSKITPDELLKDAAPKLGEMVISNRTTSADLPLLLVRRMIPVSGGSAIDAAALIRSADLFDTRTYSDPYQAWLLDTEGRLLVHPEGEVLVRRDDLTDSPIVRAAREQQMGVKKYEVEEGGLKRGYIGAFARVDALGKPLGHVVLNLPQEVVTEALQQLMRYAAGGLATVLVIAVAAAFFFARSVSAPLAKLTEAASRVAAGKYDAEVPHVDSTDELGGLARAFAAMQNGLRERERWVKEAQDQLIQSEKMGALGQLAAGITHELKDPLTGVLSQSQQLLRSIPPNSPLAEKLKSIELEARRSKDILDNLLRFARQDPVDFKALDTNAVVNEAAKLVGHQLQLNKVQLDLRLLASMPAVSGDAAQLQQVLMNLMLNAMHAMQPKGGLLTVSSGLADRRVVLEVKDEGAGISDANKKQLFTPFFTTKKQGAGLGLSVSYGIVRNHGGDIKVWSQPGVGTIFYIYLPIRAESQATG